MKLNKKGYMLVEIVLASVLAMSIALYLLNLTYQFKNKDEDIYQSISYSSDKIAITKNIMNDLDKQIITKIEKNGNNEVILTIQSSGTEEKRKIQIDNPENKEVTITYGKINNDGSFDENDSSYYQKNLQKSLLFKEIKINNENENIITIKIILESMYTDDDYSIKLLAKTSTEAAIEINTDFLYKKKPGDYVKYVGNNGCTGKSCEGQNANYVSDTNMGYCRTDENHKFNANGWRIAYTKEQTVYLISAGSPECVCTNRDNSTEDYRCSNFEITTGFPLHLANLNNKALTYCNNVYAYEGICNSNSAWNINDDDFQHITGNNLTEAYSKENDSNFYDDYPLINIGGSYYFATIYSYDSSTLVFNWSNVSNERYVSASVPYAAIGIRPVLRLRSTVKVTGGSGTYNDPYTIE